MADRYQNRHYSAAGHARGGDQYEPDRAESDPLAELARLIGQTDPISAAPANAQVPPRVVPRQEARQMPPQPDPYAHRQAYTQEYAQEYEQEYPEQEEYSEEYPQDDRGEVQPDEAPVPPTPPSWIQRANLRRDMVARQFPPEPQARGVNQGYVNPVHPPHRYSAQPQPPQPDTYYEDEAYQDQPAYADEEAAPDPARYDDALYGQLESSIEDLQHAQAYPDDPYAYEAGYEEAGEEPVQKRKGGMFAVAGILALAVVGTAAAYGYHHYSTAHRSGEPPIIKADTSPTKIIPKPADGSGKVMDRLTQGDGTEKLVPREEQPLDVNANAADPRVVFPPLNQNANPPSVASITPNAMPPAPAQGTGPAATGRNGIFASSEPRKIKTFTVRGDQPDPDAVPVNAASPAHEAPPAREAPARSATRTTLTQQANAGPNMPLSLAPQAPPAPRAETRVASTNPTEIEPRAPAASGGYLVQVSSQRNEADAKASFRALQAKFRSVLGSQKALIKRADLGSKGVYYRAMVGPFGTSEEAVQFCSNLKSAGGQCLIQRN